VGIYEVMPLSENMQELILKGANALELEQQGRSEGVLGLKDAGTMKVLQGITTIEEILAATRTD
jgi:type IV pilus assembly protein PilB